MFDVAAVLGVLAVLAIAESIFEPLESLSRAFNVRKHGGLWFWGRGRLFGTFCIARESVPFRAGRNGAIRFYGYKRLRFSFGLRRATGRARIFSEAWATYVCAVRAFASGRFSLAWTLFTESAEIGSFLLQPVRR